MAKRIGTGAWFGRYVARGRSRRRRSQLGELDAEGRLNAQALARKITGRPDQDQYDLFEASHGPKQTVAVRLDQIHLDRVRRFGDCWLAWTLWRALGLDQMCAELMPEGREGVSWGTMAAVLVVSRLCEPSSELHIAETFYRSTALEDILNLPCEQVNDDRLYRALDRLLPHKKVIEQRLQKRLGELFDLDYDLLLYDVTSTFFEGLAERNPQAQRGHSRDHRSDCKQVCIAMVVTREGMPLSYEVFDGNRVDVTTVEEIVGVMEQRFGLAGRIWVMDRGMMSKKNIAWLQAGGRRYVLGAARSEVKRWHAQILDESGWEGVRDGVPRGQAARSRRNSCGRETRPSSCVARRSDRRKRRPCTIASLLASSKASPDWPDESRKPNVRWIEAPSSGRSAGSWNATHAPRRDSTPPSPMIQTRRPGSASCGPLVPPGTRRPALPKAATSCVRT